MTNGRGYNTQYESNAAGQPYFQVLGKKPEIETGDIKWAVRVDEHALTPGAADD